MGGELPLPVLSTRRHEPAKRTLKFDEPRTGQRLHGADFDEKGGDLFLKVIL